LISSMDNIKKYKKLKAGLNKALAAEMGAFWAFGGHTDKEDDKQLKQIIMQVRLDELNHIDTLIFLLKKHGVRRNRLREAAFELIGRTVSFACKFFPNHRINSVASYMEKLGAANYRELAGYARELNLPYVEQQMVWMWQQESTHQYFFDKMTELYNAK